MYSDVKIRRRSVDDPKSPVIYLDTSSFISSTECLRCSVIGEIVSAIAWVVQVTAEKTQKWADGRRPEMIKYSKPKRGEDFPYTVVYSWVPIVLPERLKELVCLK